MDKIIIEKQFNEKWVEEVIKYDIESGTIPEKLSHNQQSELKEILLSDNKLWEGINFRIKKIYNDISEGRYKFKFNSIDIENNRIKDVAIYINKLLKLYGYKDIYFSEYICDIENTDKIIAIRYCCSKDNSNTFYTIDVEVTNTVNGYDCTIWESLVTENSKIKCEDSDHSEWLIIDNVSLSRVKTGNTTLIRSDKFKCKPLLITFTD